MLACNILLLSTASLYMLDWLLFLKLLCTEICELTCKEFPQSSMYKCTLTVLVTSSYWHLIKLSYTLKGEWSISFPIRYKPNIDAGIGLALKRADSGHLS